MSENGRLPSPTAEQAREAREDVRRDQEELMDDMTEYDHIIRFFKNKCFAFADESEQTAAIPSLINCEDKFVEAYMVTVGKVYQESRKRVFGQYKNLRVMYLFLTADNSQESLMDSDGHRINSLVTFVGNMYTGLLKLRSDALTLCEAIRQIKTSQFFPLHKSSNFHRVWRHIAEIMFQFAAVDFLADRFPDLGTNFIDFQRRIKKHFDLEFTEKQRKAYEEGTRAQEDAQSMILKGMCFRTLYESSAGDMDNNQGFASEMKDAISELLESFEKNTNQGNLDGRLFCGIAALTVYYYHHFSNFADHAIIRKVVQAAKKVPYYRILGEELFVPAEFLRLQISNNKIFDAKTCEAVKKMVDETMVYTQEKLVEMINEAEQNCRYVTMWINEFTEKKRAQTESITKLPQWGLDVSEMFLKAIRILEMMSRNLFLIIRAKRGDSLKFRSRFEIDRPTAFAILGLIEYIKKLEIFIMDNWSTIEEGSFLARQQWRKHLLKILIEARKSYVSAKTKHINPIEAATKKSFYHIAEAQCVNEMIPSRNVVLGLAYEIGRLETHVSGPNRKQVADLLSRLETFNSPRHLLQKAAYLGFLLARSWLPDLYFEAILQRKPTDSDIDCFAHALGGFNEASKETGQSLYLMQKLRDTVHKNFVAKIGHKIDADLRVMANSDLPVGEKEKIPGGDLEYIAHLLKNVQKFQVATNVIDFRDGVSRWLEEHWYSMQVLAPNSVITYTKMTELAKIKYGLFLNDPDLPMADIDETVALLDLLKNISHFCANYSYFSQGYIFIEKSSTSKKLHMIRMQDLKTSLRKHGVGLLPTAVNAAYMLIRNKLQTFLNFLSEDTVRFQIQRFLNELDAEKSSTDSKRKPSYKASWALILLTNLSKTVAESENGAGRTVASGTVSGSIAEEIPLTYVDKFRSIITQIGNAISLVRMLCQAARDNGYTRQDLFPQIKKYMNDLEATTRGMILTNRKDHPINHQKILAAYRLKLVKEMFEKVSEERNYTKMLCAEFKSLLLSKSNLKEDKIPVVNYFHGVIPALTITHIDYMVVHENRVKKTFALKHNKDLVVAEDGFAAGVAFLLHVLNGWDSFFAMNWFESYTIVKENEVKMQSENRTFSQSVQMRLERLQTELKILNNLKMNFGIQHTIFTMN